MIDTYRMTKAGSRILDIAGDKVVEHGCNLIPNTCRYCPYQSTL